MNSTPDRNFSPEQSLQVIQSMIDKTRQDISVQSPFFLLWGWCTFVGCIAQFVLKVYFEYEHHYFVWFINIPCTIVWIYLARKNRRRSKAKTYVNVSMGYLWTGIAISIFVLSLLFIVVGYQYCFPFFMLFYGLGTFVSGKFLQFAPFVIGGMISWCLAAISIWFSFDYQTLFAAASILLSYIIPGYMIARTEKVVT
jgi:hypothetical protein